MNYKSKDKFQLFLKILRELSIKKYKSKDKLKAFEGST